MNKIKTFDNFLNESNTIESKLKNANTLKEIQNIVDKHGISKGDLMKIAYDNNTRNVDSAIPSNIWKKLKTYGGTYWFVMDYKDNKTGGKLVHLGEKILGNSSDWRNKLQ